MSSESPSETSNTFTDSDSIDTLYAALANSRRLYVILRLQTTETPLQLDTLAAQLAGWETEEPPESVSETTITQIRSSLHHTHIPKLAATELVHYDADTETISPGEAFPIVESLPIGISDELP